MLKAAFLKLHAKLPPRWALIRVNFDPTQENWAKSKGWALFHEWALFRETTVQVNTNMTLYYGCNSQANQVQ